MGSPECGSRTRIFPATRTLSDMTAIEAPAVPRSNMRVSSAAFAGWRWLLAAALLLPFANLRTTIPVVAWIAPAVLLRFLRVNPSRRALIASFVVVVAATAFQFRGMIPAPPLVLPAIIAVYGFVFFVPFLVDTWIVPRLGSNLALFVFPLAWTACDYGMSKAAPYGTWGSVAYTQYGNLPLMQIVSVTGIYGLTFLVGAFASVANHTVERSFVWSEIRASLLTFASLLALVLLFGGIRLNLLPDGSPTVRIASLTSREIDLFPNREAGTRLFHGEPLSAGELDQIRRRASILNEDLLARSDREAAAGAKIVLWGETNAAVLKSDEAALFRRASELARRRNIYLLLGVGTLVPGHKKALENKAVLISPDGNILWEYRKARPVPGQESAITAPSNGRLKITPTPYGRLSSAICFDLDFPDLVRQAAKRQTDIFLAPSNDWIAIDPWHTQMAVFRAIEGGFGLVRHTTNGLSMAVDAEGRVLSSMDHFRTSDHVLVSEVPTRGVRTPYARLGDWFPQLAIAALAGLLAMAFVRRQSYEG